MNRFKLTVIFLLTCITAWSQAYRTLAISPEIHTIEVNINGDWNREPIMKLNSNEYVHIGFDRISENSFHRLRYRITHCDANWKKSKELSDIEYLDGFNDNPIEDDAPSINTTMIYTHFNLDIPNRDVKLRFAGNYAVEVYEEDNPDNILLMACFSVLDTKVNVGYVISTNTDIDSNKEHQQLGITVNFPNLSIREPLSELKVFVQQNNRIDNERQLTKPSFINTSRMIYEHSRDLIFEAGNEYRRFETGSYRANGMNVAHIKYDKPYYSMYIATDNVRANRSYSYDQDQNGRFVIRSRESNFSDTEADYFFTHFTLAMNEPLLESIYINGDFTNNTFSDKYEMKYDYNTKEYKLTLLLKQGLYNYQYLTKMGNNYSTGTIEGNYFETENEYTIFVYYRPIGERYDSLIGLTRLQSREK
ncbi:DUF5103 domain-containing protein [Dysgonomonas sp. ZJ279]|uniref:type IX secretion system plug protein n=1 Tax=Dysgonomonas sp. ZJ279 TaxID=2709796 RepID=UPI0013EB8CCD|nr:DUF5103 domain-containing protein [Dysgonomonas sp. ZJ279]